MSARQVKLTNQGWCIRLGPCSSRRDGKRAFEKQQQPSDHEAAELILIIDKPSHVVDQRF